MTRTAGDREPLALAAGQDAGKLVRLLGEPEEVEEIPSALAGLPPRRPCNDSRERHVLERAHPFEQVEELEHEPDVLAPQARTAVLVPAGERHPCQHDLAARRRVDAGDQLQQRRLPAPRRSDDRHELAGGDLEVDAAERPHRRLVGPEAPAEAVDSQDLVHGLS